VPLSSPKRCALRRGVERPSNWERSGCCGELNTHVNNGGVRLTGSTTQEVPSPLHARPGHQTSPGSKNRMFQSPSWYQSSRRPARTSTQSGPIMRHGCDLLINGEVGATYLCSDVSNRSRCDLRHTVNPGISGPSRFGFLVHRTGWCEDVFEGLQVKYKRRRGRGYCGKPTVTRSELRKRPFHGSSLS